MVRAQASARGAAGSGTRKDHAALTVAAIGLGSNLGDRADFLERALAALARLPGTALLARSSFHETRPLGPPQPDYLNAAALVETALAPEALLAALLGIETALGRVRAARHGPRTIDLDLLVHGSAEVRTESLVLPHPELRRRAFVLAPLAEIAPDLRVPPDGRTVVNLLAEIAGPGGNTAGCSG